MALKASQFDKTESAYIKGDDVKDSPKKFIIEDVEAAETPDGKPALQLLLKGGKKFTLNKTNLRTLAGAYGDLCANWVGQGLIIRFDPTVMYAGKMKGGVRVTPVASNTPQPAGVSVSDDSDDLAF